MTSPIAVLWSCCTVGARKQILKIVGSGSARQRDGTNSGRARLRGGFGSETFSTRAQCKWDQTPSMVIYAENRWASLIVSRKINTYQNETR
jgi:hypothetical protein